MIVSILIETIKMEKQIKINESSISSWNAPYLKVENVIYVFISIGTVKTMIILVCFRWSYGTSPNV